jgi:hypothetical protein
MDIPPFLLVGLFYFQDGLVALEEAPQNNPQLAHLTSLLCWKHGAVSPVGVTAPSLP